MTGRCFPPSREPAFDPLSTGSGARKRNDYCDGLYCGQENTMTHDHETPAEGATLVTDPVCGMRIDPATAATSREHDGTTFSFCSTGCADTFDADPHRYGHAHA